MGVQVKGLDKLQAGIAAAQARLGSRDFMDSVVLPGVDLRDKKQNIENWKKGSEGEASGSPWAPLTEGVGNHKAYAKWKRRNWTGKGINVWRGDTRDSLTKKGPDRIARVISWNGQSGSIELGSKAKLARKMQKGEKHSTWQVAFLKEKTPRPQKPKKIETGSQRKGDRQNRSRKGKFKKGFTRKLAPLKWFVFFFKTIPARQIVGKSERQAIGLRNQVMHHVFEVMGTGVGARTPMGRQIKRYSQQFLRAARSSHTQTGA